MSIYELDISGALAASERRGLYWELTASDEVRGVFLARDDVLAVLYSGDRRGFEALARRLAPGSLEAVR